MIYPSTFERKVGFDSIRTEINRLCTSAAGRDAASAMLTFSADRDTVVSRLEAVDEMLRIISEADSAFTLGRIADIAPMMAAIRAEGTLLSPEQLLDIHATLTSAGSISSFFASRRNADTGTTPYPRLDAIAGGIMPLPHVAAEIARSIDRFGQVKDSASAELAELRRRLASTQASVSSIMRRVIARGVESGWLEPDTSATMRDGRLVVPVAPMHKRKISGIVHDESASGKTYFIEPAEIVETNNRIRELKIEEKREVNRILRLIADALRPHADDILATLESLGHLDFVHAKALYAADTGGSMPHISEKREIEWYHAVHPVLLQSLRAHGKEVVPLDIRLTPDERIIIISGPNAGGKSVCLKTVGIIQYMTQSGLLPTLYDNSHTGIFKSIFIDIGDDQSIEDDLSTYSSHLRNMRQFITRGDDATIVLIDEFGSGTEPLIGGAIAQAILRQLNDRGMWGVITTHYQNIKNFADSTPGLVNGSMLYDRHLMQPLFKLSIGNPGSSFALEIARKTGLPADVIADAEEIAGSDYVKLDRYLLDIARDRRYWENKRDDIRRKEKRIEATLAQYEADAEALRSKRREIIEQARTEAQRIIADSNASVERTIRDIREAQAEREATRAARQRLDAARRELNQPGAADNEPATLRRAPKPKKPRREAATQAAPKRPFAVGDNVTLQGQQTVGTILSIDGKQATVNFGMLKTVVALDRLNHSLAKPAKQSSGATFVSTATQAASRERQLNFSRDIDVRGMRVDEAIQAVTYFVDDAIQFNAGRVRILHGTGTGALRQAIRQYLDTVAGVARYADEHVQFGGAGITVVDLE